MRKFIETTGRSEEDAISAALFQLGLDRDDISVEVLERAKSGFLGFGSSPAKVRVYYGPEEEEKISAPAPEPKKPEPVKPAPRPAAPPKPAPKPTPKPEEKNQLQPGDQVILAAPPKREPAKKPPRPRPEPKPVPKAEPKPVSQAEYQPAPEDDPVAEKIKTFLLGLLEHLEVQATPAISVSPEGNYQVVLQGQHLGAIIGRRGETLDSIQQLTSYSVNRGAAKRVRIHVDAENYRAKREESLQRLAVKVAGKVVKFRKNMALEPMNAYERHVIHTALQDYPNVSTYSTGVDPNRRTVVAYSPK
ncbi:MAG: KH domain-containing protein [Oscillospiraceae bacterium]|jgi:spoIIIJ-associated protein|nr:KH domain-containing protein [Oscillospiraceae bacterium]MCI9580392.1 KH domain-containing protein [Oscillospiraceae bacterium]